jgi:glutamate-1-semialdehyde 2,1-aminomutase
MGSISPASKLDAALEEIQSRYIKSNTKSKQSYDQACKYLPGGNTRTVLYTTPFPLTFSNGESTYLTTLDGERLIDFLGEYTAGIYGHNHPVIKSALDAAIARGWNYGGMSGLEAQLAQIVCERFPAIELVRFVNSGTEANMMALATAVAFTGKKTILVFTKGYHGSTISVRAPSTTSEKGLSINLPHDFVVATYNDVTGTEQLVKSLSPNSLAAILLEPMLGSGGCYPASPEFMKSLRKLADEHKALLIIDEVMTSRLTPNGLGATFLEHGVKPDLVTLGKWIGGGMSFGAFGGRKDIMSLYDPRAGKLEHPGTFNNNVFSMSAGIAGCSLLTPERIHGLNTLGNTMQDQIKEVLTRRGIILPDHQVPTSPIPDSIHDTPEISQYPVMFVQGMGSLMVIHFTGPQRGALQTLFFHHMLEHGIHLAQRGFIALNIMIGEEEVRKFVNRWKNSLRSTLNS